MMNAIRKFVAFALMIQMLLSTVGYAMVRTECMVTGSVSLDINTLNPECALEASEVEAKPEAKPKPKDCSKHSCCKKQDANSPSEHTDNDEKSQEQMDSGKCCEQLFAAVHLQQLDINTCLKLKFDAFVNLPVSSVLPTINQQFDKSSDHSFADERTVVRTGRNILVAHAVLRI
jgi:hypothetical protein